MEKLTENLAENKKMLQAKFNNSADFYCKDIRLYGVSCCICMLDGLSSLEKLWNMMLEAFNGRKRLRPAALYALIVENSALPIESEPAETWADCCRRLTAGTALVLVDGIDRAIVVSTQSLQFRSVQEAETEGNLHGSREGFVELMRVNISLVRRLIRTEMLCIEVLTLGTRTHTEVALLYNAALTPKQRVAFVKRQLQKAQLPMLFDSAYLMPFIQKTNFSLFSAAGYTQRPDTAAAKICEGKMVLLVNGSPSALILPYTFSEHFSTMDDYASKAYFASFMRVLKYTAFAAAVLLPGVFVAMAGFTPQLFPPQLLVKVAASEAATPLPLFAEAVLVNLLLEIVREAGLRMPKAIGHTVSLVAALIIGDAAVSAGLLGTPIVVLAALSSVCAYVVPSLYTQIILLRLLFILAGGLLGPFGIAVLLCVVLLDIAHLTSAGKSYTAPLLPLQKSAIQDGLFRAQLRALSANPYHEGKKKP